MQFFMMRARIMVKVAPDDRRRLEAIAIATRRRSMWRAKIILATLTAAARRPQHSLFLK
jgi:hypothetical protein